MAAAVAAAVADLPIAAPADHNQVVQVLRVRPHTPRTRLIPPPVAGPPRVRLLELTGVLVAHDPPTIVGPVDAAEAADVLLDYLQRHGYLGQPA